MPHAPSDSFLRDTCCFRYSLGAACTVTSTGEQLQDPLRRTVQAEKDSIAAAAVCLEASRIPEAATPVADLCTQGTVAIQAQLLTPPACCLGSGEHLLCHQCI